MSARTMQGTSAGKAGWVIVLLLVAWVVFLFAPFPSKEKRAPASALPPVAAQSKLEAVGLANNVDWAGLPDYFAVWSDRLPWVGDQVRFAYWNPGSSSYSYAFEASRLNGRVRFRAIPVEQVQDGRFSFDAEQFQQSQEPGGRATSPMHPFVFPVMPEPPRAIVPHLSPPKIP